VRSRLDDKMTSSSPTQYPSISMMSTAFACLISITSLATDFVSQTVIDRLSGNEHSYASPHPMTVCSGLDSTCYQSARVIDIGISFLACDNIKKTIFLTPRINAATTVDLIIGRESLHLHNFFDLTPEHLGIPKRKEGDILDALQHNKACTCPRFKCRWCEQ
jgi:hypothetical protein